MSARGITTVVNGIEYRSRLEARWALFFEKLGWDATYEPFDGDGYIPDFLIAGDHPMLVEVKPAVTPIEYGDPIPKVTNGLAKRWTHDILIVGASPIIRSQFGDMSAGFLGENQSEIHQESAGKPSAWTFNSAMWAYCRHCGETGVYHEVQTYAIRPCGHYDGDGYLGDPDGRMLRRLWAEASNEVKWRAAQ